MGSQFEMTAVPAAAVQFSGKMQEQRSPYCGCSSDCLVTPN